MPLQNRVLPDGAIVKDPARGLLTGNRGILHDGAQNLIHRWTNTAWICCALEWKGTRRTPMTGRSWTALFFLDEAVALASGHRPCTTCRRAPYNAFRAAWAKAELLGSQAPEIDAHLHALRLTPTRHQRLHLADGQTLPDGGFILHAQTATLPPTPHLILGPNAYPFTPAGYLAPVPRPTGPVQVMTPAPLIAALSAEYRPILHPSAF